MDSAPTLITYLGILLRFAMALLLGGLFSLLRLDACVAIDAADAWAYPEKGGGRALRAAGTAAA
jgi:hypothetical protein